ncbi:MAG: exo-beta-N-acetylmuramidase NamZ domain-containing protein, partial [Croceibacterium sp.]
MKFGIDRLLSEPDLKRQLERKRVALVAHPASVTVDLTHSLDALIAAGIQVTSAFGPQHGLKGDKQDNMVETVDEIDPHYGIPIFSLYGEVRRPSGQMMSTADVFLFD